MEPFGTLSAVAAPIEIAKVDTGMILPGRYMRQHRRRGHDYSEAFLHDLRFDEKEQPRPDFALNQAGFSQAQILVTDADFGCGSSREGAAYAVLDFGVRALIGPSFGDIFYANCLQNGVLPIVLPFQAIRALWQELYENPGATITIDLPVQSVTSPSGKVYSFEINALRKDRLVRGIDDIDVTLHYIDAIQAFETQRHSQMPWLPTSESDDGRNTND